MSREAHLRDRRQTISKPSRGQITGRKEVDGTVKGRVSGETPGQRRQSGVRTNQQEREWERRRPAEGASRGGLRKGLAWPGSGSGRSVWVVGRGGGAGAGGGVLGGRRALTQEPWKATRGCGAEERRDLIFIGKGSPSRETKRGAHT